MENQTEFDLNRAIRDWRWQLNQSPAYRSDNLEELESHLRDSVAALSRQGLSEEEAFLIANRRLGAARALEPEFAKVNGKEVWLNRLLWMLVGVQAWGLISSLSSGFSRTSCQFLLGSMHGFGPDFSVIGSPIPAIPTALFFFADIAVLTAVVAGCWWLIRRSESWVSEKLCKPVGLACGAAGFCVALCAGAALNWLGRAWMAKTVGPAVYGELVMSMSIANMALHLVTTLTLAVVTVVLIRRHRDSTVAWTSG